MPLESATFINQLVETNPTNTDVVRQGDDHIRLIKAALKATFPNITGPVTVTQAQINSPFPQGGIIMWSGSIASIPEGWALCDGTNGTPDLRDRFIVGAGTAYTPGDTGGSNSVTLTEAQVPAHTHTFSGTTGAAGNHTHTGATSFVGDHTHPTYGGGLFYSNHNPGGPVAVGFTQGNTYFPMTPQPTIQPGGGHFHSISVDIAGSHTHTLSGTTGSVGSGEAHENRPPYFALAYIMKL